MRLTRLAWLLTSIAATLTLAACNPPAVTGSGAGGAGGGDKTKDGGILSVIDARQVLNPIDDTSSKPPSAHCGDRELTKDEACDDGNTESGDGCAGNCLRVEPGYSCIPAGQACHKVARCGDGIVVQPELCDDGNTDSGDGCSDTCKVEIGFKCDGNPSVCTHTTCGDKTVEGAESCDDGNAMPFDGCSSDCQNEPDCKGDSCQSRCGDGIVLNEDCDDGNNLDGDGCSHDCKVEAGYECKQPEIGDKMMVPVIYRDFHFSGKAGSSGKDQNDFENGVTGQTKAAPGMVKADLDSKGKPVYANPASPTGAVHVQSADSFATWFDTQPDSAKINHATAGKLALWKTDDGTSYVNRWGANGEKWAVTQIVYWCGQVGQEKTDATTGDPIPCTFAQGTTDCDKMDAQGLKQLDCFVKDNTYQAHYVTQEVDGNPLFFPVDDDKFSNAEEGGAQIPSEPKNMYDASGTWPWELDAKGNKIQHNFAFTSEVRYWFKFDSSKPPTLDFVGDDDVWVFINRKLALDIGGIHTPVEDSVTLDNTAASKLGLKSGNVYEIAVFQAERQTTCSSYKLTLSGFNAAPSDCRPICGDGVVGIGEECDNGVNEGGYGKCGPDCKMGEFCGDGVVQEGEDCDDGINNGNPCPSGCRVLIVL